MGVVCPPKIVPHENFCTYSNSVYIVMCFSTAVVWNHSKLTKGVRYKINRNLVSTYYHKAKTELWLASHQGKQPLACKLQLALDLSPSLPEKGNSCTKQLLWGPKKKKGEANLQTLCLAIIFTEPINVSGDKIHKGTEKSSREPVPAPTQVQAKQSQKEKKGWRFRESKQEPSPPFP